MGPNGNATCPCKGTKPVLITYQAGSTCVSCECTVAKYEALYGSHAFTVRPLTD